MRSSPPTTSPSTPCQRRSVGPGRSACWLNWLPATTWPNDHFIILAGKRYREHLLPHLAHVEIPMEGLPIGKQLQFLKQHIQDE